MKNFLTYSFQSLTSVFILILLGCGGGAKQSTANLSFNFPKDAKSNMSAKKSLTQKQALNAVDYSQLCFAVNITGTGINEVTRTCDIPKGLFVGSVDSGGSLSLTVNSGADINVQIYGLLKSKPSDVCPTGLTSNWKWPLERVYFLGETDHVMGPKPRRPP